MKHDTREFTLGTVFLEGDETTQYWLRGDEVLFRAYAVRGADVATFRFYLGSFAKDLDHCYCTNSRLSGGNPATFRALNFCYATDGQSVWTLGGRIKDAEAESFVVCDDGVHYLPGGSRVPYGYGKDRARVYYYDYDGKPNWVRKASAASFVSLNDGQFGKDDDFIFCGAATLPKANVGRWQKIGGNYSKDDVCVYYFNREMREADYGTFEVMTTARDWIQLAKDKNRFYNNDRVIDQAQFEKECAEYLVK